MSKCDFCRDELKAGNVPACVAACPIRALIYGEFDELRQDTGRPPAMAPLPDHELTAPSAVFKPHKMGKPLNSTAGHIANPEETKDA